MAARHLEVSRAWTAFRRDAAGQAERATARTTSQQGVKQDDSVTEGAPGRSGSPRIPFLTRILYLIAKRRPRSMLTNESPRCIPNRSSPRFPEQPSCPQMLPVDRLHGRTRCLPARPFWCRGPYCGRARWIRATIPISGNESPAVAPLHLIWCLTKACHRMAMGGRTAKSTIRAVQDRNARRDPGADLYFRFFLPKGGGNAAIGTALGSLIAQSDMYALTVHHGVPRPKSVV